MGDNFDISGITGASDKKSYSIQNNYRFDALIRAIDFFSQKFNLETLTDFAGDFINEILTLSSSAVFVYDEEKDCFTANKIRLYKNDLKIIPNSKNLQDIARLYGSIFTKNFSLFFPEEFVSAYNPALLIPFIHNNELHGFIITDGKAIGEFDEDDYSMAKALMLLFNDAFERNYYDTELEICKKQIDSLAFELYTANKTSGILFNEIDPDKILSIGLDILSEVSGSRSTAFAMRDAKTGLLTVRAYKSLKSGPPLDGSFVLYLQDNPIRGKKEAYHIDFDGDELKGIFKNPELLSELNAEYIVLVEGGELQGFVTLGKQKTSSYSNETLDIIGTFARDLVIRHNKLTSGGDA